MKNDTQNTVQEHLCICSVQKKELGFEDYRFVTHVAASELGFTVVRNPENVGITQDSFEKVLWNEYPVFILITGEVQSDIVSREFKIAKEHCLPMFIFVKTCNGNISIDSERIISDLSKVAYDYQCTFFENCEDLYKQVKARLGFYLVDKANSLPKLEKGVGLAYRTNERIMGKSKRQIVIYQRTSILLLGPRSGCNYEHYFYRELIDWFKKMDTDIEFLHVFNYKETTNELRKNHHKYNLQQAKETLMDLYRIYESNEIGNKINIRYSKIKNSIPYVITDTNFVFVVPIEDERYTIELPSHIMKMADIERIKDELYLKTIPISKEDILKLYSEVIEND